MINNFKEKLAHYLSSYIIICVYTLLRFTHNIMVGRASFIIDEVNLNYANYDNSVNNL